MQHSIDLNKLATILKSAQWTVYATDDEKIYFVNNTTKGISAPCNNNIKILYVLMLMA